MKKCNQQYWIIMLALYIIVKTYLSCDAQSRRSMGPIDESQERYTLDCYFRQNWRDERLVSCDWLIADNTRLWLVDCWQYSPLIGQDGRNQSSRATYKCHYNPLNTNFVAVRWMAMFRYV